MKRYKAAKDVKCGVIGYGGAFNMGREHLRGMQGAGMTPCAVAELDASRLEVAKQDFPGIETYHSVEEMLAKSKVDLIAVITPHNTHARLAQQCLEAGRNVVVEKPMAITTEECDSMIAAAKASGVILSTYHNRHWDGCILRAVEEIRGKGAIGDVFRIEAHMGGYHKPGDWWRTSRTISGGILYDWGVHLLEYSLQLLQGNLVEVSGFAHIGFWAPQTPYKDDTNEDEAHLVARFDSGQWLELTISALDSYPKGMQRRWVEVTGTKGTYLFDGGSWMTTRQEPGERIERQGGNPQSQGQKYYENVAAALLGKADLIITAGWARRPIHILDLAVRSAKEGRALAAKYT
jgi:scyllo-inositol 2-dehydrogenase (NADP+)